MNPPEVVDLTLKVRRALDARTGLQLDLAEVAVLAGMLIAMARDAQS